MRSVFKKFLLATVMILFLTIFPKTSRAGMFEVSLGGSFTNSDYGDGNYEWTRRWGASVGYYFTELTELEFAFQDVLDRTVIQGYEDTTFHDQITSLDLVQYLAGKNYAIQPYVKIGAGQLNRKGSGTYFGVIAPPSILDELTVVAGVGLKLHVVRGFSVRAEGTTYLVGGALNTWQNNFNVQLGISLIF